MSEISNLIKDVVASPLGDIIAAVGQGVADAQQALDEGSLAKTLEIYSEGGTDALQMLREIGYSPTFYTLPETTGEVRIAMRLGNNQLSATPANNTQTPANALPTVKASLSRLGLNTPALKTKLYATPVDAGYSNRYGYQADISAKLTFKIVPVPSPQGVDELRILPDLTGATAAAAQQRLAALELEAIFVDAEGKEVTELDDSAIIQSQTPPINPARPTIIRRGESVTLVV